MLQKRVGKAKSSVDLANDTRKKPGALRAGSASKLGGLRTMGFDRGAAALKPRGMSQQAHQKPSDRARATLMAHGMPGQLIPNSTTGFTFDEKSGRFTLNLARDLSIPLKKAGITLVFARAISGTLRNGAITNIQGISGKKYFFSAKVSTLEASGNILKVHHSSGTAELPIAQIPDL